MKTWQFCLIMSLVALAPNMNFYMSVGVGVFFYLIAFVAMVLNK